MRLAQKHGIMYCYEISMYTVYYNQFSYDISTLIMLYWLW